MAMPVGPKRGEALLGAACAIDMVIAEMARAADEIPGYRTDHPGVLGEETLRRALAALCPLWPFC